MVVTESSSSIDSTRLPERGSFEDSDDACSSESEIVGEGVGSLSFCFCDSRYDVGRLHLPSPSSQLIDEVECHSESSSSERMS